jgi:replicative DNA helicase
VDGWSKEEIDAKKKIINENLCNKITDAITIPRSHIDETHVRHYRYKQKFIDYPEQAVPIDPYFLGLWLGDGTARNISITSVSSEIIKYWCDYAELEGLKIRVDNKKDRTGPVKSEEKHFTATYHINSHKDSNTKNTILGHFQNLGLIQNKNIPEMFFCNSKEIRLQLLAGLIDTDGYAQNSQSYEIQQKMKG